MAQEIWIPASIGRRIDVSAGQKIAVIDVRGGQAVDFLPNAQTIRRSSFPQRSQLTVMNRCA